LLARSLSLMLTIVVVGLVMVEISKSPYAKSRISRASKVWYGKPEDVAFAKSLWAALHKAKLVGPDRINVHASRGKSPHAAVQQVLASRIHLRGRKARVIVKANHTLKGATVQSVYDSPNAFLEAYTVMFKREPGYDPPNHNWFWVKYNPAGRIDKDSNKVSIAGHVDSAKGYGCISCHKQRGGADLEVLTSK